MLSSASPAACGWFDNAQKKFQVGAGRQRAERSFGTRSGRLYLPGEGLTTGDPVGIELRNKLAPLATLTRPFLSLTVIVQDQE